MKNMYKMRVKQLHGKIIEKTVQKYPPRLPNSTPNPSQSAPKVVPKPTSAPKGVPKGPRDPKILKNVAPGTPKINNIDAKSLAKAPFFFIKHASKNIYKYPAISHGWYKDFLCTCHGISAILHSTLTHQKLAAIAASKGRR